MTDERREGEMPEPPTPKQIGLALEALQRLYSGTKLTSRAVFRPDLDRVRGVLEQTRAVALAAAGEEGEEDEDGGPEIPALARALLDLEPEDREMVLTLVKVGEHKNRDWRMLFADALEEIICPDAGCDLVDGEHLEPCPGPPPDEDDEEDSEPPSSGEAGP